MRSLPVLLIALALLPLADALKCHLGLKSVGPGSKTVWAAPKAKTDCQSDYCAWIYIDAPSGMPEANLLPGSKLWSFGCGEVAEAPDVPCDKDVCMIDSVPQGSAMKCCCKGDLCNGSETATPPRVAGGTIPAPKLPGSDATPKPGSGSGSGSLKCKARATASGLPAVFQQQFDARSASAPPVETCKPGIEYCVAFSGVDKNGYKLDGGGCQDAGVQCAKEGCAADKRNFLLTEGLSLTFVGQLCCCKGDMCTPATPVPGPKPDSAPDTKCYMGLKTIPQGVPGMHADMPKFEMPCSSDFCLWKHTDRTVTGHKFDNWLFMCGEEESPPCKKEGCEKVPAPAGDGTITTCCCKGDLCNGSETATPPGGSPSGSSSPATAPTALLSLAAAVLAARF